MKMHGFFMFMLLILPVSAQCITIGQELILLLPSEFILNIVRLQDNVDIVELFGQVLYDRDALAGYIIVETIDGGPEDRPSSVPVGHSLDTGQWVWLPVPGDVGAWYFIDRNYKAYQAFMDAYVERISAFFPS